MAYRAWIENKKIKKLFLLQYSDSSAEIKILKFLFKC